MNVTPENITELQPDEILVFGANEKGIHGGGLALVAMKKFGAQWGCGFGPTGQCYALPTKDRNIQTLPLDVIGRYVAMFLRTARECPTRRFLVTRVGCGLAGLTPKDIAPLFFAHPIPDNVYLPDSFWKEKP